MVITILKEEDKSYAIEEITKHDMPCEVVIQELDVTRSIKQNSLLWLWYTEISQQMEVPDHEGNMVKYTKEDWHDLCRMKFLGVKIIKIGHKEYPRPAVSTKKLSVKKMSDYLLQIESHFLEKGVLLTFPDYYGEAIE